MTDAASVTPRNTLADGYTGTRLNIGCPQPSWGDGVTSAQNVPNSCVTAVRGTNAVIVGIVITDTFFGGLLS